MASVVLGLTLLTVDVGAQAQIVFSSERSANRQIYVMEADGGNLQNLTNSPNYDISPAWYGPDFAVAPAGKKFTMRGGAK